MNNQSPPQTSDRALISQLNKGLGFLERAIRHEDIASLGWNLLREDLPSEGELKVLGRDLKTLSPSQVQTFRRTVDPVPAHPERCPFCPGHEHETPPEVARLGPGSAARARAATSLRATR